MPISDEFAEQLIRDLRAENAYLLDLLLKKESLTEIETRTEIGSEIEKIGREPWYIRQARLEKMFRKPKLSEVTGIPEEVDHVSGLEES